MHFANVIIFIGFSLFLYEIQLDRTTLSEQEEEKIEQLVYDHLKGLNSNQTQIKCNAGDGPLGDLVEEITISRPILVRWRGFLACTLIYIHLV